MKIFKYLFYRALISIQFLLLRIDAYRLTRLQKRLNSRALAYKMAKYTVKHACGHEREYQLFGKNSERERRLEWLATQNCPECKRAADAKKNAEAIAGTPFAEIENVPLKGSEKQVARAQAIRRKFLAELSNLKVNSLAFPALIKFFSEKTDSKFWIDVVRGTSAMGVIRLYTTEIQAIHAAQNA